MAVVGLKIIVARAGFGSGNLHHATPGVASHTFFNLDDLSPEVTEHHGRDRSLLPYGPVKDTNSFQRLCHTMPSL